jgi:hypothetical protein
MRPVMRVRVQLIKRNSAPMNVAVAAVGALLVTMAFSRQTRADEPGSGAQPTPADESKPSGKALLDFDFFGAQTHASQAQAIPAGQALINDPREKLLADQAQTRRWMLRVHQTLGLATWALLVATSVIGQLNYNQLYGGGGGKIKWQGPHRILVISSSTAFAATASFSLLAPTPYKKPLRFDTGLVHRIAVSAATLGMLTQIVLGWRTTHQAAAGNPNGLRDMARAHQVVGYTTLGFLTVAAAVWVF